MKRLKTIEDVLSLFNALRQSGEMQEELVSTGHRLLTPKRIKTLIMLQVVKWNGKQTIRFRPERLQARQQRREKDQHLEQSFQEYLQYGLEGNRALRGTRVRRFPDSDGKKR